LKKFFFPFEIFEKVRNFFLKIFSKMWILMFFSCVKSKSSKKFFSQKYFPMYFFRIFFFFWMRNIFFSEFFSLIFEFFNYFLFSLSPRKLSLNKENDHLMLFFHENKKMNNLLIFFTYFFFLFTWIKFFFSEFFQNSMLSKLPQCLNSMWITTWNWKITLEIFFS